MGFWAVSVETVLLSQSFGKIAWILATTLSGVFTMMCHSHCDNNPYLWEKHANLLNILASNRDYRNCSDKFFKPS